MILKNYLNMMVYVTRNTSMYINLKIFSIGFQKKMTLNFLQVIQYNKIINKALNSTSHCSKSNPLEEHPRKVSISVKLQANGLTTLLKHTHSQVFFKSLAFWVSTQKCFVKLILTLVKTKIYFTSLSFLPSA